MKVVIEQGISPVWYVNIRGTGEGDIDIANTGRFTWGVGEFSDLISPYIKKGKEIERSLGPRAADGHPRDLSDEMVFVLGVELPEEILRQLRAFAERYAEGRRLQDALERTQERMAAAFRQPGVYWVESVAVYDEGWRMTIRYFLAGHTTGLGGLWYEVTGKARQPARILEVIDPIAGVVREINL